MDSSKQTLPTEGPQQISIYNDDPESRRIQTAFFVVVNLLFVAMAIANPNAALLAMFVLAGGLGLWLATGTPRLTIRLIFIAVAVILFGIVIATSNLRYFHFLAPLIGTIAAAAFSGGAVWWICTAVTKAPQASRFSFLEVMQGGGLLGILMISSLFRIRMMPGRFAIYIAPLLLLHGALIAVVGMAAYFSQPANRLRAFYVSLGVTLGAPPIVAIVMAIISTPEDIYAGYVGLQLYLLGMLFYLYPAESALGRFGPEKIDRESGEESDSDNLPSAS